ncbi:MAG: hypothetical protein WAK41_18750 [Roseiarcus sp.]|jgi:hypothetical protein|uniref:hypothetical protein n=2 Tax=Roseiarcus sp. TaxID=1969460 RepID=UPI003BB1DDF2
MNWSNVAKGAALCAVLGSAPLQAGAMEIGGGPNPASQMNEGFVQSVVIVRGPHGGAYAGRPGGMHAYRPGYGGVHRGYHPGYRPGYAGYRGPAVVGGWARPGWYHWGPGGAIAAGAAIGVLGAAAVAAWAPPAPAPGLCWYYTDPSQRSGFWDACP